jgi:hypothetical protein
MSQTQDMSGMIPALVPWVYAVLAIGVIFALIIGTNGAGAGG